MQIHELPSTDISNTDKIAFDTGTNTYAGQFVNIANKVLEKLPSTTYSDLETSATNVIDAINELATTVSELSASYNTTYTSFGYGFTNVQVKRRGKLVEVSLGATVESSHNVVTGDWYTLGTLDSQYRPSANAPYDVRTPQNNYDCPFLISVLSTGALRVRPMLEQLTGYVNATYWYFIE